MKKLVVFSALAALVLTGGLAPTAEAQQTPSTPHKVALIDMAHVFKNYKKFESQRETLKTEIASSEEQVKKELETLKVLQGQLKMLEEGSAAYSAKEKELATKAADIEAYRKVQQRDFLRKESKIYKEIYMEVTDAVNKYATFYKYTLVLRFNREELQETDSPPEVINRMNRQVVFHRTEDDITDAVLDYLNKRFAREADTAVRPAGAVSQ